MEQYADWYRGYYERNLDDETRQFPIDPAGPRVVLVPGLGIVTVGPDAGRARFARDLYHRAIAVEDAADALGGFHSLSESEAFAIEYWPLERYKLAQSPPRGELAGRVALITGGASGIGRAAARLLAERGAHVVVADLNLAGAREVAAELISSHGLRRALAVPVDVADEAAVQEMTRNAVLEYGGIDILVASAGLATSAPIAETTLEDWELNFAVLARGYFLAAREVFRVLLEQDRGGSVVFVASKNALVAGANAAAYSSAKAASLHLARCLAEEGGPHGIRVNTVNPDAVIEGSSIWSSEWKAERASTYGVTEDDLEGFYRKRTKLGVERPSRGCRRSNSVLRRPPFEQVDRQHPQRRRRRHRRVPTVTAQPRTALVEMRGIAKSYGGVHALDDVSFAVEPGKVHALVGENGAGKSTLVKILTGVVHPDQGELRLDGEPRRIGDPQTAHRLGIVAMYQEPTVFPDLSVAENVFAGRQPRGPLRTVELAPNECRRAACAGRARSRLRPGHAGTRARGRRSAADRDRQGPHIERPPPDHGRADGGALAQRGRSPVRDRSPAP